MRRRAVACVNNDNPASTRCRQAGGRGVSTGEGVPSKIFGIGLSKTGTSSLAQALQRLGYRTKDCMGALRYARGNLSSIDMDTVLAHDALTDTPIPSFYRELDARFPGSKFILTVRDRAGWLQSCRKQFNEKSAATRSEAHRRLFEDLYGTDVFDEARFADGYDRFVAGVHEHFRDRPGDLLVLDVAAGEGWDKLCPFLRRPVPDLPFPKANVTQIRWIDIEDLVSIAQAAGQELLKRWPGGTTGRGAAGLLRRALGAAVGPDAAAAARAACKVIEAGLQRRSPGTPVVGPGRDVAPYGERKRWNHLWLVDPLDGVRAFQHGHGNFTVNLALVEDGVPMYGVVHAPALGATWFGRVGKGAFRRSAGGATARLPASPDAGGLAASATSGAQGGAEADGHGSHALRLCEQLARAAEAGAMPPADEWRVAAAHAVIAASGAWSLRAQGVDPAYNGESLQVAAHRLARADAA
jgi:fructose-1,6-bisphosphatase/inositol monophosphatase family enzyme